MKRECSAPEADHYDLALLANYLGRQCKGCINALKIENKHGPEPKGGRPNLPCRLFI